MIEVKTYCDKCGKEISQDELHKICMLLNEGDRDYRYQTELCKDCWAELAKVARKFEFTGWLTNENHSK